MFQFLIAILLVFGAVVVIACVALAIAYCLVASRLTRRMRETVAEIENIVQHRLASVVSSPADYGSDSIYVPPMRIHLEAVQAECWPQLSGVDEVDHWLRAHQFQPVGEFSIPALANEQLKTYLADDGLLVAALRHSPHESAGDDEGDYYLEFCCDLGDGRRGGVSNPPLATVQLPEDAVGRHFHGTLQNNPSLLSQMWLEAKEIVDQHVVFAVRAADIPRFFEEAHAAEMDVHLQAGGLSESLIRDSLAAQGQAADADDIAAIESAWQTAIDQHLLACSRRSQIAAELGQPLLVVHQKSAQRHLLRQLDQLLTDMDRLEQARWLNAKQELTTLLERFTPRDAIARLRPLLPARARYELIEQIEKPLAADVYRLAAANPSDQP